MRVDRRSFVRSLAGGFPAIHVLGSKDSRGEEPAPGRAPAKDEPLRVRIWCERTAPKAVYPDDVDGALAGHLGRGDGIELARSQIGDPQAGLSDALLDRTDVLIWWGHLRHDDLPDDRAAAVARRVQEGRLGFVALYASCCSKPFKELMKTSCQPGGWREDGRPEHVSVKAPDHPIARGIAPFTIPRTDMYCEPFAVPKPEAVVFVSSWEKGETLRSGLTWTVGEGRVAYLRTGPDGYPVLFHPSVRRAVSNSALWAGRRC
ncbi:Trehalose utilization [Aquisphaera giovannonii]|uniref:Trehalose utilization n=1 Tax=Aquisphaera giovannonii TaxID=406548 RepID=A0A5B9W8T2_9BACT|nr:ThuA domain-containing protein [Aquisphaera giovannonii]QEH36441.1 Trehalose utilization [Aquisphaera giovannonii]